MFEREACLACSNNLYCVGVLGEISVWRSNQCVGCADRVVHVGDVCLPIPDGCPKVKQEVSWANVYQWDDFVENATSLLTIRHTPIDMLKLRVRENANLYFCVNCVPNVIQELLEKLDDVILSNVPE